MPRMLTSIGAILLVLGINAADWSIHPDLKDYFESEVEDIEKQSQQWLNPASAELWKQQEPELRRQLSEMLGLDPMPAKTPLSPVVTRTIQKELYTVENMHFQSMPGLYVTGNLYIPREIQKPLPAILYVSGHAHAKEGDVSYGNKTAYQHHGIWFAKHGFVCMTIDTIQLG
ncbi:alpha/beta hydrolase family protein, partial [Verrucomicrobia bacterium]|nr:alpha/beta hydrolase family protein [Verrucomicrobiota bacterium]